MPPSCWCTGWAGSEKRAAELKAQLDAVPGPLVLLAHSQGGLDARWLVTKLGYSKRVKAVVTIATPHHGSIVADVALGLAPGPLIDASDGIVPEPSAHWGRFMGSIPADHIGEVDHPFGYTPKFDAQAFYRTLLQRFHDEGW